jgi:hypothetical protein
MTEELHEVSIEAARRRELERRRAEDAERFIRDSAFDRPFEDPLQKYKREADEFADAVERENQRRKEAEARSAEMVTVYAAELEQMFKMAADTIEAHEAEIERLRLKVARLEKRYKAAKHGAVER